jgi:hypothetical protein
VSLDDDTISAARKIGDGELSRGLRVAVKEYQRKTTAEIASTEGT